MKSETIFNTTRRLVLIGLALMLMLGLTMPAYAADTKTSFKEIITGHNDASFTYELFLTDQNGASVTNPRRLSAGDTIYVEIELTRNQFNDISYESYGIEFRLLTRGLTYNNDGATLRSGTQVVRNTYMDGDSVGFAWYDMTREGESFANPVLAASWSYTVEDPGMVNITVPVALIFVTGEDEEFVPVGTARLYLDVNGGEFIGKDVSGEYPSGKAVTLPDARFGDYIFEGWSDGVRVYPAGTEYVVSGIVTLTAQWADLVRDRYVSFILNGGMLDGEDPSGYYADGETIILPHATKDGYRLVGWTDGVNTYKPGDKYEVYNTVNLTAIWEAVEVDDEKVDDDSENNSGWWIWLLLAVLLLFWLIILLWKRRWVKYSLVNGDIALYYKSKEHTAEVRVILCHQRERHLLGMANNLPSKQVLKFIHGTGETANVKAGKYRGLLIVKTGEAAKRIKCRIRVLDKELKEK